MIIDCIMKKIAVELTIIIFLNKFPNPRTVVNAESRQNTYVYTIMTIILTDL